MRLCAVSSAPRHEEYHALCGYTRWRLRRHAFWDWDFLDDSCRPLGTRKCTTIMMHKCALDVRGGGRTHAVLLAGTEGKVGGKLVYMLAEPERKRSRAAGGDGQAMPCSDALPGMTYREPISKDMQVPENYRTVFRRAPPAKQIVNGCIGAEWSTRIVRNDMIKLLFKNNPEKPPEIEELGEEGVEPFRCVGVSADPFAVRNYYPPRGRFST
ncbi:hypothetical protein pipiens_015157 [Culex pipiens pipiens]|uniref:Uncharacterized protein n=1 Tax=Culex pipiens pipiens TaxID=38569 RepID=A0ABD1CRN4_CULPP